MGKKTLYLLSGLGADKRVFDFLDLSDYDVHHVSWITPERGESLQKYAIRILPQIVHQKPVLLGVSFGGMIAQEIAKSIPVEKVILISSATSSAAIPSYLRLLGGLGIQKLIPPKAFKRPNKVLYWLFGITSPDDRKLLAAIMASTDERFFAWAIESISKWNHIATPEVVIQIHGTHDRILAFKYADHTLAGGGHLMIVNRAKEISAILRKVLNPG
jgi:pimeloyl-ACP methyl ester carboxylesterase